MIDILLISSTFSRTCDLKILNCSKSIENLFFVSFAKSRYGFKKSHRKILKNFGRKSFSKKVSIFFRDFSEIFKISRFFFLKKISRNFFDQNFSIFFDIFFCKPYLLIKEGTEKQISSKLEQSKCLYILYIYGMSKIPKSSHMVGFQNNHIHI